ncbi:MAG: reverse transcriptase family protein, partial [Bacteroidota bacterium]
MRLCVDYRKLNQVTKADRFPVPNMTDLVFSLRGTQFFTALDLVRGYYQVPLDPETAEYTAFSTPKNHYQFKRLSFGLKNAPGAFQREMTEVLRQFDSKEVIVYIDDVLILGKSFEEH